MPHPFFETRTPLVFAHRGGSALAPENTIAAIENALSLGVDGLELDVRLSRDGIVMVHHDERLDRTTSLQGEIEAFSADELGRADAGYHFSQADVRPFRGLGIGVPTLASALDRCRDRRVIIEMKVNHPDMARGVVDVVRAADAVERTCLGAFGLRVLRAVRTLDPSIATSAAREEVRWALYRSWCRWPVLRPSYQGYQVPEFAGRTRVVSPRFIADAHRAGLAVQVWTVDTSETAQRLLQWGADALITDRPDLILPICHAARTQ